MLTFPSKDPTEVLDYQVDWAARLGDDEIATSVWSLTNPAGLAIVQDNQTETATTVWLSGGTVGLQGLLLNRITTVGGRQMDETAQIAIQSDPPATDLLIPLEAIKARLQIENDGMDAAGVAAQDDAVKAAFLSAVEFVEKQTHLTLQNRAFTLKLADWCIAHDCDCSGNRFRWSDCSPAFLERVPTTAIESIEYLGRGEITTDTLDPADYSLQPTPSGGLIHLRDGVSLPDLERRWDAVQITYRAGFDQTSTDPDLRLPHALANALILLTGYWFNNRDAVGTERVYALELGAESLMTAFRLYK